VNAYRGGQLVVPEQKPVAPYDVREENVSKTIEELKVAGAKVMDCKPNEIVVVHVSPTYGPCDHEWPDDPAGGGTDMSGRCTKCGMSFIRYIHMVCP